MNSVAFDIGGTSMRVALITEEGIGEVKKIPTPEDPKEGIAALASLMHDVAGPEIGAAAGGFPSVVEKGIVRGVTNLPKWERFTFSRELSDALESATVLLQNDADMAALGEAMYGAGKGKKIVAYLGIGTGVGGGRIVEGTIDVGACDVEPGHQIVDCAGMRTLESFVSGRAFEKRFGVHPKDAPRAGYEEMTTVLAVGIHNTILHWSPEVLVLGGSMVVGINGYNIESIGKALQSIPDKVPLMPPIVLAELKDSAGLFGARALLARHV